MEPKDNSSKSVRKRSDPVVTPKDPSSKEGKVDLISDVVKFVAELNEKRYHGDTILKTLMRVMNTMFIDKYEFDMTIKSMASTDTIHAVETTLDRLNFSMDRFDVKMNQFEVSYRYIQTLVVLEIPICGLINLYL